MMCAARRSILAIHLMVLASCSGGAAGTVEGRAALATVDVVVTPADLLVAAGATATFTASVTGSADTTVTWSIPEGAAAGSIDRSGAYVAPRIAGTYHVVATSNADPSRTGMATVTVAVDPPSTSVAAVTIAPTAIVLSTGARQAFACTISGVADPTCTFAIQEGAAGGSIDDSGLYTAPPASGTYHVVATSRADRSKIATASIIVTTQAAAQAVAVSISPSSVGLSAGGTQAFACTVTGSSDTSCTFAVQEGDTGGTIDTSGRYTAPSIAGTYHVVTTSHADATKSASATVTVSATLQPISVSVTPTSAAVSACQSVRLSAAVAGSSNQAVTWSIQEGSAGGAVTAQGVYTAPSTAGTYHAVATSQADGTKAATVAIVVSEKVLGVSVSPANVSLQTGQTVQFTATVTTTCGAFASSTTVTR